jgi:hypothetical protein
MELEIVLVSSVMECEPARFLVVHGDAVHALRADGGDRHHSTVDGLPVVVRLNLIFQRDAESQPRGYPHPSPVP